VVRGLWTGEEYVLSQPANVFPPCTDTPSKSFEDIALPGSTLHLAPGDAYSFIPLFHPIGPNSLPPC